MKLTQGVVGAGGAGVWLFTNNEIFYCAGAGNASNDERLRLEVISKLVTSCQVSKDSLPCLGKPTAIGKVYDASYSPGCAKSLLVEPIYQGHDVAGALAVFSDELNAFTERDAANIHLLADVLEQALSKATEAGLGQSVALEPKAMLQLIERIIPALQRMLESDENVRHSTHGFPQSEPEHELPAAGMDTKPPQESHESGEEARATRGYKCTWDWSAGGVGEQGCGDLYPLACGSPEVGAHGRFCEDLRHAHTQSGETRRILALESRRRGWASGLAHRSLPIKSSATANESRRSRLAADEGFDLERSEER